MRRSQPPGPRSTLGVRSTIARRSWWIRRRLRSPFVYWLAAATIGVLTTSALVRTFDQARSERDRYGEWTSVAVARHDVGAGEELLADDVRVERLPATMVPRSAWKEPPIGMRLREPVVAGEVLVRSRTSPDGSSLSAQLRPDRRAIAVPVPKTALGLRPGDRIEVIALDATLGTYAVVAAETLVLRTTEGLVTLDVDADDVAAVAGAVASGTAQLVLTST